MKILLACLALSFGIAAQVAAEPLADASTAARFGLQALDVPDLSASSPLARQAMQAAREKVNHIMQTGTDRAALLEPLASLCMLYHAHGADSLARACYDNLRILQPHEWRWHYYSGYLSQKAGFPQQALQTYASGEPGTAADTAMLQLRKAQAWLDLNQLQAAQAAFQDLLQRPGLAASAHYGLGQVALLQKKYSTAIEHLQRALELQPQATRIHFPLAQALRASGRQDEARDHLARQGKGSPQAEDPLIQAVARMATGARPLFMAAMDAIKQKDLDAAIGKFKQGLDVEPGNGHARVSLARALYLDGQTQAARLQLQQATDQANSLQGRFLLAVLQQAQGQLEAAEKNYQRVLAEQPTHGGAHYYLARLALDTRQLQDARRHALEAVRFDTSNYPAFLLLAEILGRLGAESEMQTWLLQAIERFPDQPVFSYALVRLQSLASDPAVRNPATALATARRLMEKYPIPPHQSLLALALAANNKFSEAEKLQGEYAKQMSWTPLAKPAARIHADYQAGILDQPLWPESDPVLRLGPVNAHATISSYPVARPF